jgi:hypothetical protein
LSNRHRKQNHELRDTQNEADSMGCGFHDFFKRTSVGRSLRFSP